MIDSDILMELFVENDYSSVLLKLIDNKFQKPEQTISILQVI